MGFKDWFLNRFTKTPSQPQPVPGNIPFTGQPQQPSPKPAPAPSKPKPVSAPAPAPKPSPAQPTSTGDTNELLSSNGEKLLLDFEVGGGKSYYDKFLARPTWPGYESGVTIGVGYDLRFHNLSEFESDWQDLDESIKSRLRKGIGAGPQDSKALVSGMKDIHVPWDTAYKVFKYVTVPKWFAKTRKVFPGFDNLPKDAQAALVSVVFNRGESLTGSRRVEMANIRSLVPHKDLTGIAANIRSMKRLWKGTDIEAGMNRRREAEAVMVENA